MLVPSRIGQVVLVDTHDQHHDLWHHFLQGVCTFQGTPLRRFTIAETDPTFSETAVTATAATISHMPYRDVWLQPVLKEDKWPALIVHNPRPRRGGVLRSPEHVLAWAYDLKLTAPHRERPCALFDKDGTLLCYLLHSRNQAIDLHATVSAYVSPIQTEINTVDPRVQMISPVPTLQYPPVNTTYEVTRYPDLSEDVAALAPDDSGVRHHLAALRSVRTPYAMMMPLFSRVTTAIKLPEVLTEEIVIYNALNPYNGLVYTHGAPILYPTTLTRLSPDSRTFDGAPFHVWAAVAAKLRVRIVTEAVVVHDYAQPTPQGRLCGIVAAYQEAYRLQRTLDGHPPYANYAECVIAPGYAGPLHQYMGSVQKNLHAWIDGSRYARTFRYQCVAARLGRAHAQSAEPRNICNPIWLHHVIEHVNTETA